MSNYHNPELAQRKNDRLESCWHSLGAESVGLQTEKFSSPLFLTAESDVGVVRNGGRKGAALGARCTLNQLKKLLKPAIAGSWADLSVVDLALEKTDFALAQQKERDLIHQALELGLTKKRSVGELGFVHLGGGHDHVYPLLMALKKLGHDDIRVLNIDAHCDTRPGDYSHSGNPFRLFSQRLLDKARPAKFKLLQVGIHPFANTPATLEKLPLGEMSILLAKDYGASNLEKLFADSAFFQGGTESTFFLLSLDCDALSGHAFPAVSAVNPSGLSAKDLGEITDAFMGHLKKISARNIGLGVYEMNPLYEGLDLRSFRFLAQYLWDFLS